MKPILRRSFFSKISIGAIGFVLLSKFPFKHFAKKRHDLPDNIKIKIHPNSVSRNK